MWMTPWCLGKLFEFGGRLGTRAMFGIGYKLVTWAKLCVAKPTCSGVELNLKHVVDDARVVFVEASR